MDTDSEINHVIFFDGICNPCNSSINFVIDRDPKEYFKFASLQSPIAKEILSAYEVNSIDLESIIFYSNHKVYHRSRAALEIVKRMKGAWPILYIFIIIPKFIRDFFYNLVARNRYKWFGKQDTCRIPTPDIKSRFIDS